MVGGPPQIPDPASVGPDGPVYDVAGGCHIEVWVVPGASRDQVSGIHGDRVKVRVSAPAESGKANRALCALVGREVDAKVTLVSGEGSRSKVLLAKGVSARSVRGKLGF